MYAILAACSVRDWMNAEDVNGDHVLELEEFYSQYGKRTKLLLPYQCRAMCFAWTYFLTKYFLTNLSHLIFTSERSKHVNKEMSTQESARTDRPTVTAHEHQTSGYPTPLTVEVFTEKLREPMAAEQFTAPRDTVDSTAGSPAGRNSFLGFRLVLCKRQS